MAGKPPTRVQYRGITYRLAKVDADLSDRLATAFGSPEGIEVLKQVLLAACDQVDLLELLESASNVHVVYRHLDPDTFAEFDQQDHLAFNTALRAIIKQMVSANHGLLSEKPLMGDQS